jgi:two-component system, LytTR family, sensor kinase
MVGRETSDELGVTRRADRWLGWFWYWAGWTALALFLGISSSLAYLSVGNPPRWSLTLRMSLAETYVWAAIAPFVTILARRFPFTHVTIWRSLPVHVAASIVVSVIKLSIDRVIRKALFGFSTYMLITSVAPNVLFYWGIVAAAHGLGYYRASKEKELRASQLEARLAQARLQLLQMQLHPHFLFNTLHTISELVHENPETADNMITGLSELLRETLYAGDEGEVPLRRELDVLRRYLDIQRTRFGDRLQIDIDIDPGADAALVPLLLLQPIVENAIHHGLGSRAAAGRVRVVARTGAERLIISIEDNGRGVQSNSRLQEGVGLGNTRARLEQLYGTDHAVTIESASGGGAVVTVSIPLHTEPR